MARLQLVCDWNSGFWPTRTGLNHGVSHGYPAIIENASHLWFLERQDGIPGENDVFTHVPLYFLQSRVPVTVPVMSPRREKAARRIQVEWRNAISNPYRLICRKRLLYEFEQLTQVL